MTNSPAKRDFRDGGEVGEVWRKETGGGVWDRLV
jgi:hypothetical protein